MFLVPTHDNSIEQHSMFSSSPHNPVSESLVYEKRRATRCSPYQPPISANKRVWDMGYFKGYSPVRRPPEIGGTSRTETSVPIVVNNKKKDYSDQCLSIMEPERAQLSFQELPTSLAYGHHAMFSIRGQPHLNGTAEEKKKSDPVTPPCHKLDTKSEIFNNMFLHSFNSRDKVYKPWHSDPVSNGPHHSMTSTEGVESTFFPLNSISTVGLSSSSFSENNASIPCSFPDNDSIPPPTYRSGWSSVAGDNGVSDFSRKTNSRGLLGIPSSAMTLGTLRSLPESKKCSDEFGDFSSKKTDNDATHQVLEKQGNALLTLTSPNHPYTESQLKTVSLPGRCSISSYDSSSDSLPTLKSSQVWMYLGLQLCENQQTHLDEKDRVIRYFRLSRIDHRLRRYLMEIYETFDENLESE